MMSEFADPVVLPCGDAALSVQYGEDVDPVLNARVLALDDALARAPIPGIIETIPTYRSLFVSYDPVTVGFHDLARQLLALARTAGLRGKSTRRWRVPVVYGGAFGIDLEDVAKARGLTPDELVRRHAAGDYRVYMIGFIPGFAYLGGLDPSIATPRRDDPRLVTPAGTISIGGVQAGIQCLEAPSGWHLLGRTPVRTYHPGRDPVFLMEPGDAVSFYPIVEADWDALDAAAAAGEPVAEQVEA
jgi:KipI family sensor histidine kinase inhibitor